MCVGRFDEDEFVLPDFVESAHALPCADYKLHVKVGREEDDDAIGGDFGEFQEQRAVIAYDTGIVADLKAG